MNLKKFIKLFYSRWCLEIYFFWNIFWFSWRFKIILDSRWHYISISYLSWCYKTFFKLGGTTKIFIFSRWQFQVKLYLLNRNKGKPAWLPFLYYVKPTFWRNIWLDNFFMNLLQNSYWMFDKKLYFEVHFNEWFEP